MLMRVVAEEKISPCRALELGCGTGTNSIWLAQQGFKVVGVDISSTAIDLAKKRPAGGGVAVTFMAADILKLEDLRPDFRFFFDRGCYHVVRKIDVRRYMETVVSWTLPGAIGLILAGNAKEPMDPGPPVVSEEEFRKEWGEKFEILWLREFRFDQPPNIPIQPLGWAGLVRKK
jgi:SAM-dependent methyltransferase